MSSTLSWKSGSLDPCGAGKGRVGTGDSWNVQEKGIVSAQGSTVTALPRAAFDPALDSLNLWYLFWIYDSKSCPKGTSSLICSPRLLLSCCFTSSQTSLPLFLVLVEAKLGSWSWNREDAESKSFLSSPSMLKWLHRSWMTWIFHHPKGQNPCHAFPGKGQMHQTMKWLQRSRSGVPLHLT